VIKPRFARRLGWRSLRKVATFPGDRRPESFWRRLAKDMAYAMADEKIVDPITCAHFVSQVVHESDLFRATTEYASGEAYDIKVNPNLARSLGNVNPGDGRRYRGRSLIMITGRSNYRALPHWDGIDFEKHPARLAEQKYAARAAAWWWRTHGLNDLAVRNDHANVAAVTRVINGGTNGLAARSALFALAYHVRRYLTPARRPPS
jgi:putative chitinase